MRYSRSTWKAWFSTDTQNAADRMAAVGPWLQEFADGGTLITFNNPSNLRTTPVEPISIDEYGQLLPANTRIWTGTNNGQVASACMNWGAPTAATYGLTGTTFPNWSAAGTDSCVRANHVLCFQQ